MPLTEQSDRGGGALSDLNCPKALLPAERLRAAAMVTVLPTPLNQQVLDEWAGIIAAGEIRSSSLGCLRVAQARKVRRRAEAAHAQVVLPEPPPIDEDNPLVRRLMGIAQHSSGK